MPLVEENVVLVYRPKGRDVVQLGKACKNLGCSLIICENAKSFQDVLIEGNVFAIVVDLGSPEAGEESKGQFIRETSEFFWPEDAGILIIYSTEGATPENWSGDRDPRFVTLGSNPVQVYYGDEDWFQTIKRIRDYEQQATQASSRHMVEVNYDGEQATHFSREARLLVRAAFREMSRVQVSFRDEGLSGSIGFIIQPFDLHGYETSLRYFGKLYRDDSKANNDYRNWDAYVRRSMSSLHYPSYDVVRGCKGRAFSLLVTELLEGPENEAITLREMVKSDSYSVDQICKFLTSALGVLEKYWKKPRIEGTVDLLHEYLGTALSRPERLKNVESELIAGLGLGSTWETSVKDRLAKQIHPAVLSGKSVKKCHGDLHADNIMPRCFEDKLIPAFIDFSNTHPSKHYLTDHVALEPDLIINSLEMADISSFLELLSFDASPEADLLQDRPKRFKKILHLVMLLRKDAKQTYGAEEGEYLGAALHRTLNLLSYGNYPPAQYERAIQYCKYLIEGLKSILS